ncbi:cytochrome b-c1 complex subunit 1, mitochondrial [Athene noctua]|uniref:cytochrome b-c1 complex subunit 1, mitochondrial n=1 Tax=Athene noctua TaxID=126797 RepID=UPI003EBCACEF
MAASSVCRAGCAAGRALLWGPRPSAALLTLTRNRGAATYAQTLHNIPETQVTTLDNGLRVASEESNQPTCTVGVWIGVGSRHENKKNNGAGYFLEHLAFKGTKKRPCAAFEKEVESMGAHLNGYTSREEADDAASWQCPRVLFLELIATTCWVLDRTKSFRNIRARDDGLPVAHIALAVEGPGWADPDNVVLNVANAIIGRYDRTFGGGKNQSSRLATLAVEHNLCHSFQTFNTSYSDTGLFGFHFVSDPLSIDDMMYCAQREWMRLCTSTTESEVKRAKNYLRNAMVAQLDGTTPVCENIGSHLLNYGRRIPLEEWDARIAAVDARMVREVCSKYIYDKCPAIAAVGPIEQLLDYNRIRSAMYWIRF